MKLVLSLLLVLGAETSLAAFSNYNSILIGDQVAGMGGAGTAMVGDVAASPFYNPATLGFLEASAFSAAVGVYKKFDTLYGEEEDFTAAPMRVNQGFFRSLPSSVGSALKLDDWILALSIVVPDYDNFKGDLYNRNQSVTTLSFIDESLWVGGSASKKISQSESLGLTLYYTARNFTRSLNDRNFASPSNTLIFSSEKTKTDNSILLIAGYYKELSEKLSWGLSLRPRSFLVASKTSIFETDIDTGAGTQVTVNEPDRGGDSIIPAKIALGSVYKPNSEWVLSGDLSFHEGLSYEDGDYYAISSEIKHRPTWNIMLGAEYHYLSWLKLRVGGFTDFSSHPDPDPKTTRYQGDHVDKFGFSANFAVLKDKIKYTFGGYYTNGTGVSHERVNQSYETIAKTQHVFTMLVGTSYYF